MWVKGTWKEECYQFCLEKESCVSNTWTKRKEKRKVTFSMGENETDIDFVLIEKEHERFIQNVKAITGEFQHPLVIAGLLNDLKIRNRFEEKVIELGDVGVPNLWTYQGWGFNGMMRCEERRG